MSFPFGLKNWQVCQQQILSVFIWKCLFRLHFWWTVLLHIEFWVDSFLQSIFCHSTPFWFPLSPVTSLLLLYECSLIWEESFFSCCFQDFLFLWLATVWLCTGMERSVFMLLEVCWDSWMSFSNTFLAIISLNGFCVCVCCPNHGCNLGLTEPLSPLTRLSSRLSLQSIRPRAGLLPTTLNRVSPFSPLQRSCWSSQPAPAKQNIATNRAQKGHGRSPRPKVTDSHCSPQSSAVSSAQTLLRLLYASGVFPECWNSWFFGSILSCFIAVSLGKGPDNLSSFNHG